MPEMDCGILLDLCGQLGSLLIGLDKHVDDEGEQDNTDDHAEETMKAVLDALERDFGASMR